MNIIFMIKVFMQKIIEHNQDKNPIILKGQNKIKNNHNNNQFNKKKIFNN